MLLNDVLCGRDGTCSKIITDVAHLDQLVLGGGMDKKNSDGWDEDVKACEDLFAGCPQLLVGELHQGHQVVRVLRNKSWEYCKNLAWTKFF